VFASYVKWRSEQTGMKVLLVSVEHEVAWYEAQRRAVERFDMSPWVKLVHAPSTWQRHGDREVVCYDQTQLDRSVTLRDSAPDLVLVDGPVGTRFGGPGREGSLLQALSLVKPGGLILLHDALRREEYEMLHSFLRENANVTCKGIVPDADGLAVFEKVEN